MHHIKLLWFRMNHMQTFQQTQQMRKKYTEYYFLNLVEMGAGPKLMITPLINTPFEVSNGSKQVWGRLHAIIWQQLSNGNFLCGLYLGFAEKGKTAHETK